MADSPLVIANHRAGAFHPMQIFNHRGGLFREGHIYRLPADLGVPPTNGTGNLILTFSGSGSGNELTATGSGSLILTFQGSGTGTTKSAATTVLNITDLLIGGEVLGTVNDTVVLQTALMRVIKRQGVASTVNVTTPHVTIDFEDTYWRSENSLGFPGPREGDLATTHHVCQNWPKGMTWRNGGIEAVTNDGFRTTVTAASDGDVLPPNAGIVNVVDNDDWPTAGKFRVANSTIGPLISYTGKNSTRTAFTGCTVDSGTGTLSTGMVVYGDATGTSNGKNRNRHHLRFNQNVQRPNATDQWFTLENFWIKGPRTAGYDVDREGQEGFYLQGQQWIRFIDCQVEGVWADAWNIQARASTVTGRDNDVHPGMIEILGGTITDPAIMNMTMVSARAPDAIVTPGSWKNDPEHVDVAPSVNNMPSASGTQYGLWWHGNAAHPFVSTGSNRSIIDMELVGSFGAVQDIRMGADSNRNHFRIDDGGILLNGGKRYGLQRRWQVRHILRNGEANVGYEGSPSEVLDDQNQRTTTVTAGSNNQTMPAATTINVVSTAGFPAAGRLVVEVSVSGVDIGSTHVNYAAKTGTSFTGCTSGIGTMFTGNTVRDATIKRAGTTVAAGSNGVVIGAFNSSLGGTGILYVNGNVGMVPDPKYMRIWTDDGIADVWQRGNKTANEFNDVIVSTGTGFTLRTGQAVTMSFTSAERNPYTCGDMVFDDIYATQPSQALGWNFEQVENVTVVNCRAPYRAGLGVPFANNNDVPGFNKGVGPAPFGSNNFFPV